MKNLSSSVDSCERAYKKALEEEIQIEFLNPRLLKREEYIAGITGPRINSSMRSLMRKIDKYEGPELIVAGFDREGKPILIELTSPGLAGDAQNAGSSAIGSGDEKAVSRLLWADTKRTHPLERVLWDVFDAKANAELAVGVGYEWDAAILVPGKVIRVEKRIKNVIERAWSDHNRSPFEKHNSKEDLDLPPRTWPTMLRKWAREILPDETKG